jgi:hypothetical protein
MKKGKMCGMAGIFAFFQAMMPMIGWVCVHTIVTKFAAFEKFIPWIALILLAFIGGKMLYDGIKNKDSEEENTEEDESEDDDEKSKSKKNSLSYNDDDEDEGSEDDDDPIKDPFADNEDIPDLKDLFKQQGGGKTPREATLKEIIELLQSLSGDAREGARKALEDMLSSGMFNESLTTKVLTEAKNVREMTDDEFGDYINGVYDLIDEIKEIEYIDPKEVIDKKTKVNQ